MNDRRMRILAGAAALLSVPVVLAQSSVGSAALPLRTQKLEYSGVAGLGGAGALSLRTQKLEYTGVAGR